MTAFRIVQLSDTHLSRARPFFQHNWEGAVELLNADPPDLVIVTGDITLNGAELEDDLAFAAEQLQRLRAPVRVVPGNHDIGDNRPTTRGEPQIDAARRDRYRAHFGPDWWIETRDGWRLCGLNSLLIGSGLPAEADQQAALDALLAADDARPVALFFHKPLYILDAGETALTSRCWEPAARGRLLARLAEAPVRLIATGHLHEYRTERAHGADLVWAPSTAFVVDQAAEWRESVGGRRRVGLTVHELEGTEVRSRLVEPPMMINADVGNWLRGGIGLYLENATGAYRGFTAV